MRTTADKFGSNRPSIHIDLPAELLRYLRKFKELDTKVYCHLMGVLKERPFDEIVKRVTADVRHGPIIISPNIAMFDGLIPSFRWLAPGSVWFLEIRQSLFYQA